MPSQPRPFNGNRHQLYVGECQRRFVYRMSTPKNCSALRSSNGIAVRLSRAPPPRRQWSSRRGAPVHWSEACNFNGRHADFPPCLWLKARTHQPQRIRIMVTQGTYWSQAELLMALSCPALIDEEDIRPITSCKTAKKAAATKIHKPFSLYRRAAITATTRMAASMSNLNSTGMR